MKTFALVVLRMVEVLLVVVFIFLFSFGDRGFRMDGDPEGKVILLLFIPVVLAVLYKWGEIFYKWLKQKRTIQE